MRVKKELMSYEHHSLKRAQNFRSDCSNKTMQSAAIQFEIATSVTFAIVLMRVKHNAADVLYLGCKSITIVS